MNISPDQTILWESGFLHINKTLLLSWIVMGILIVLAILTRMSLIKNKDNKKNIGKLENAFELIILTLENQIKNISKIEFKLVFPVIASIFLFILMSNLLGLVPGFEAPTASLSTTLSLTIVVIILTFYIGFKTKGLGYFQKYIKPSPFLLPLNIISDVTTTFSLSVRLYGNIMAGGVIAIILSQIIFLSIGFPVIINLLGTITSFIQAYIFSILAMIFISAE